MLREILSFLALSLLLYYYGQVFYFNVTSRYQYNDSCGYIFHISTSMVYPKSSCSDPSFELVCENNKTVLYLNYGRHLVQVIRTTNSSLQSIIGEVVNNNCSTMITLHSMTYSNISDDFSTKDSELGHEYHYSWGAITLVSCENPVNSPLYVDIAAPCASGAMKRPYSYVLPWYIEVSDLAELCSIELMVRVLPWGPMTCNKNCSHPQIVSEEMKGLELRWQATHCGEWEGKEGNCWLDKATNMVLCHPEAKFFQKLSSELARSF